MRNPRGGPVAVVALVASAGSLDALTAALAPLPASFPAAVVIVRHVSPGHKSGLALLLGRKTALQVREAEEGDALLAGVAYIAPPDRHLLVKLGGTLSLSEAARVHFVRPSAEPLLESLAVAFEGRAIAVVLTGGGSDGSLGVRLIKQAGGMVIAQDEASSESFGMPAAAIATGCVDMVVSLLDIAPILAGLVGGWAVGGPEEI